MFRAVYFIYIFFHLFIFDYYFLVHVFYFHCYMPLFVLFSCYVFPRNWAVREVVWARDEWSARCSVPLTPARRIISGRCAGTAFPPLDPPRFHPHHDSSGSLPFSLPFRPPRTRGEAARRARGGGGGARGGGAAHLPRRYHQDVDAPRGR